MTHKEVYNYGKMGESKLSAEPSLGEDGRKITACAEHLALARKAGTEGMVLLKNAGKILPLAKGSRLALFGKAFLTM